MERFKNILLVSVGARGDMAALVRANRLALSNRAQITLVRVIEDLPPSASYFLSTKQAAEIQEALQSVAQSELEKLKKNLDSSLRVTTRVLMGKPFVELIRAVNSASYDIIIKPKEVTGEALTLQSVDLHLLRKCPCPMWIVNSGQRKPYGKILIAVDPDPSDPQRLALHADLMTIGTSLARNENGKVEVVHVWRMYGESILRSPRFRLSAAEISDIESREQAVRQQWVDDLLAPHADGNLSMTLAKGQPETVLIEIIEKKKPDIVVMGTVARTGIPGLLIGNTAENVLSRIKCSVLAVKPRGFRSPVV